MKKTKCRKCVHYKGKEYDGLGYQITCDADWKGKRPVLVPDCCEHFEKKVKSK